MTSHLRMPTVTVMIPTFNQAPVLMRAIESAREQTYPHIEILISDDNSTDNTKQIIAQIKDDPRIRYVRHEKNLGRVGNYRKMIFELARGEWLLNVDGDDYLTDPLFIEKAMELSQKDPAIVLVFGRQKYLNAKTKIEFAQAAPELPEIMPGINLFLKYPLLPEGMPHIGSLYQRRVAIRSDVQSEDIITSDSESLLRVILHGQVGFINRIAGCWVEHQANESGKLNFQKRWSSLRMAEGPSEYLRSLNIVKTSQIDNWKKIMLERLIRENLCLYLDRKEYKGYFVFFKSALKNYPLPTLLAALSKGNLARMLIPGFSNLKKLLTKYRDSQNAR